MSEKDRLSLTSRRRLEEQGYSGFTEYELARHRFGIRFAYFICMSVVVLGLALKSQPVLILANAIALLGMLPPYHPLDYIYNYGIRHLLGRPKLPPRANQGRFACFLATIMLGIMNYFAYAGNFTAVIVVGAALLTPAFLVTFLDLCIPSKIYNALFVRKSRSVQGEGHSA